MSPAGNPLYAPGAQVQVRADSHPGHHRTPLYLKGKRGVVLRHRTDDPNPETMAYGKDGLPPIPVYRVRFVQQDLWPGYRGPRSDSLLVDVFEHWLQPIR